MKIARLDVRAADVPLTRPYAVASHATDAASMLLLRLVTDGRAVGLGAATPEPEVNGDTRDGALAELLGIADAIAGRAVAEPSAFSSLLAQLRSPGARMALDLAPGQSKACDGQRHGCLGFLQVQGRRPIVHPDEHGPGIDHRAALKRGLSHLAGRVRRDPRVAHALELAGDAENSRHGVFDDDRDPDGRGARLLRADHAGSQARRRIGDASMTADHEDDGHGCDAGRVIPDRRRPMPGNPPV